MQAVDHNNAYYWLLRKRLAEGAHWASEAQGFLVTGTSKKPQKSQGYAQAASSSRPQPNRGSEFCRETGEATRSYYSEHNLAIDHICNQVIERWLACYTTPEAQAIRLHGLRIDGLGIDQKSVRRHCPARRHCVRVVKFVSTVPICLEYSPPVALCPHTPPPFQGTKHASIQAPCLRLQCGLVWASC